MRFDSNIYYHEVEQYPADKLMEEWKETALLYDQTDFTGVWVGEHHFWYSGWPVAAPNPVQVCTFFRRADGEDSGRADSLHSAGLEPDPAG